MLIIPTEKRFDWKHTPLVLFILVLLNSMIYFGYQFGDDFKGIESVLKYKQLGFLEKEWPLFQEYLRKNHEMERLEKNNKLYSKIEDTTKTEYDENDDISAEFELLHNIIIDSDFYDYLDENAYNLFYLSFIEKWAIPRNDINENIKSISYLAYGLIPNKMSVVTLFTHQFLHGGIMHLLGNMFFLIICGFAVEAAIGHLRFLLFYLASGLTGGLLFSFIDMSSTTPLVGASGAISGVMAMYLGVFRFKKIEFFYWFFIFVGYFRAPALLILPFYIGKELFDFFSDTGSNVAFMAHAGGFVAGSILMALAYFINPKMLNEEYIEENQDIPKVQEDLAKIYENISKSRLNTARLLLDKVIEENGQRFDWMLLRYNLLKMQKDERYKKLMIQLLRMDKLKQYELDRIEKVWKQNVSDQTLLNDDDLYKFGWNMTNKSNYTTAEQIFLLLEKRENKHPSLGLLARKLSVTFAQVNNNDKKQHYEKIAIMLL